MWNRRSWWLYVRVSHSGARPRLWLMLTLALYVPHQLLLAYDGGLSLLPGPPGARARSITAIAHKIILALISAPPLTIAKVDIRNGKQRLRVLVRTCGLFSKEDETPAYESEPATRAEKSPAPDNLARDMGGRPWPPIATRWLGCLAALALGPLVFPGAADLPGVLLGSLMLTALYVLLRPLLLTLALPFNLLLAGLLTPLADALLIRWTAAWVGGLTLTYWQCVAVAVIISAAYWPYSHWKQRILQK